MGIEKRQGIKGRGCGGETEGDSFLMPGCDACDDLDTKSPRKASIDRARKKSEATN